MLNETMDLEELTYQMAFDVIEGEERDARAAGRSVSPPAGREWIDLSGPDVFTRLKQRMGMP